MKKEYLPYLALTELVLFLFLGAGVLIGRHWSVKSQIPPLTEKVDTLYIRDTIYSYKPKIVERKIVDSVLVPVTDTVHMSDTVFVLLERESVRWEDSLSVVYASGVMTSVDSVFHYTDRMIINKEVRIPVKVKPHWSLGVGAYGVATMANGKVIVRPAVGVGIQYNIISW